MKTTTELIDVAANPKQFLRDLILKGREAEATVKKHFAEIKSALNDFKTAKETVLFRNTSLSIECFSNFPVIPRPHYILRGLEIVVSTNDNNRPNENIRCNVSIKVNLLLDYNHINDWFKDSEKPTWSTPIGNFILKEEAAKNDKYGIIGRPRDGSYDFELAVGNFSDFYKLKGMFMGACVIIGFAELGIASRNKNIIELSE